MFEQLIPLQETSGLLKYWANGQFIDGVVKAFTRQMGPAFVVWALVAFGGSYAVYSRSAAPLVVAAVVVGGMAAPVVPGLGNNILMLVSIGAAAAALWSLYQGAGR